MIEIIAAAILIAFGLLAIHFTVNSSVGSGHVIFVLVVGIIAIAVGLWIIISVITLAVLLRKIMGLALTAIGLFLILGFPDITDYQPENMAKTAVFAGIILAIIGLWMLFF